MSQNAYASVQDIAGEIASTAEIVTLDATQLCNTAPPMLEGNSQQGYRITSNGYQQIIALRNSNRKLFIYNASDSATIYSNKDAVTILKKRHENELANDANFQPKDFDGYVRDVYDMMSFSMTLNGGGVGNLASELIQFINNNIQHLTRYDAAVLTMAMAQGNNFAIQKATVS